MGEHNYPGWQYIHCQLSGFPYSRTYHVYANVIAGFYSYLAVFMFYMGSLHNRSGSATTRPINYCSSMLNLRMENV